MATLSYAPFLALRRSITYNTYRFVPGTITVCSLHQVDAQVVLRTTLGCNLHRVDTRVVPGTTLVCALHRFDTRVVPGTT